MKPVPKPGADGVLDLMPDGLLVVVDETVARANAAARRLLGRDDLDGAALESVLGAEELARLRTRLRLLDAGWKVPETSRMHIRLPGGAEVLHADCRLAPFDAGGDASGLVMTLRNATEAARTERLIVHLAGLASQGFGLKGIKDFLEVASPVLEDLGWQTGFLECSAEGVRLVHLSDEHVPGHPVAQFARRVLGGGPVPWSKVPVVRSVYEKGEALFFDDVPTQLATTPGFGSLFAQSMREGRLTRGVWVPVHHRGVVSHVMIVVGADLTEHDYVAIQLFAAQISAALGLEALQNQLVRRERLAAVGEMAAVLAHEVRNPLAVIFNAVVGMRRMAGDQPDVAGLLDVVHEEADRLKRVVRDLLDFARPVVPEIQPTPLLGVVSEALDSVRTESQAEGLEVRVDLPASLPAVAADPFLLRRAVVNILDNAFHGTPEGGAIHVRGERVEGGRVRLAVHNDGEPLPPAVAARVFEPFFTNRATGTGLGLTVVRRIVEDLGGEVTLDEERNGVSFSIWLPESREAGGANGEVG
jgi:signal transduction histidine kinase